MASPLRAWRQARRETDFWARARSRTATMREGDVVGHIDVALMTAGQAVSRYRSSSDRDTQLDQLRELRMNLEASLGMLENVIPD